MKKFLLIGGLGFVGKNLSKYLSELGFEIYTIDLKSPSLQDKNFLNEYSIHYRQGNVNSASFLKEIFSWSKFDGVYNLASQVGIKNYISNPEEVIMTSILGSLNVANACIESGTHMLFTSTSEVLGKNLDTPWKEEADRVYGSSEIERWSYGSSKGVAEQLILGMVKTKKLSATIIRFFNIYGSHQNPIFVVPKSISNCMNNLNPLLYDSGKQTRCFTYVEDALKALNILMKEKKQGIYHIGSNFEHTMEEVVLKVINNTNPSLQPEVFDTLKKYPGQYEDIQRRVPDVTKIYEDIGWKATTDLEKGIIKTIEWVKKNPWWLKQDSSTEI
tara:strand:- start:30280 stop:31269 length:990 start_codon:yes stop_codon:yes gene_type:complete